jgi:hypothetical protein
MRKGFNISKDTLIDKNESSHRVITPLYIPELSGYCKVCFEIFKLSLSKTIGCHIFTKVVNNGLWRQVNNYLIVIK